ncbi:TolB-like translocation protein [Niabella ginsengisoli]|uniref:DUF5050 domain-containing protein n=1 Tax=Niabella ginsengisoli TaxID=522298 RepID=A0ABS9SR33_9BACT|nr:hypothetical protein [Niabella ginsengisoli]MCH5600800.1 hypothetical protein [Niabella ginsengisoli]
MIRFRDISIEDQYSYRNGKIVYAAYETHPRWGWVSYSVIKILDVKTGDQRTLQHKTRYFSPDISEDGKLIAANKVSLNGRSSLIILNATDGAIEKEIVNDSITYFSNPKIVNNKTVISVLRKKDATTHIAAIDINTGRIENITPPSNTVIGTIDVKDNRIYFTASQHLKDELFYYDLKSKQLYTLPTTGVGSYFVSNNFEKLNWSSFTANGYQLHQKETADLEWLPVLMEIFTKASNGIVTDTLHATNDLSKISYTHYSSKPYRKLTRPINFHSWRPNYSDPEFSFTVYGNNILNTTETQLYYLYNESDKTHTAGGSITYGGLFPFITLGSAYTFDRRGIASGKIKDGMNGIIMLA